MKRLIFPFCMLALLSACKKEPNKGATPSTKAEDTQVKSTAPSAKLMVGSKAQIADRLTPKNNDTVYVTNFFATWCGPCMGEIPHFKEKMESLKDKPVKFTFVSLDEKSDWDSAVQDFAEKNGLEKNIVLLDGALLDKDFYKTNFKNWDGGAIPFTVIKKGQESSEKTGALSAEELDATLAKFLAPTK